MKQPPLCEISQRLGTGALSAEALVRDCLERIEAAEPAVHAWAWLDADGAVQAARTLDRQPSAGPLHGIPLGIKDVIDTADMPTAYGSPIYAGHRAVADAAVVAAIRNAGGIILGKTVTCEFAGVLPSKTRNPLDPERTPGGSSSGSAAAVAAGMVPAALGTQTAGSIIRPASYCGVVGYKPSYGLISRVGLKPLAESVDTVGVLATCVDDAAWVTSVIAGRPEIRDIDHGHLPPRIAVCRTDKWSVADPDGQRALQLASQLLIAAGAHLEDCDLPFLCSSVIEAGMTVIATEARRALAHELRTQPHLVSQKMRDFIAKAEGQPYALYEGAQRLIERERQRLDAEMFSAFDAILTLSAPGEAPRDLGTTGNAAFSFAWSLLHVPCMNIPGLFGSNAMPIGVQLIGRYRGDAELLRIARWAEPLLGKRA
jgi:amidase